jgi:hypothetical protein
MIVLMLSQFAVAAGDLPDHPAGSLHERFLGWIAPKTLT